MKILLIAALCLLTGCSHVSQIRSAQKKESAAVAKNDQARRSVQHKEADYNREASYALSLPPTPQTIHAAQEVLSLQYDLTGIAPTSTTDRDKFVDDLIADDAAAHRELSQAARADAGLRDQLVTTAKARDAAIAKVDTLANQAASIWDRYDKIWDVVYALIALGVVVLILWLIAKFGTDAAAVAAKVP